MSDAALRRLDVSYVVNYFHCDLRCPYCISDWNNQRGTRTGRAKDSPPERVIAILRQVAALPYRVHLTVSNTGEALLNPGLLSEVSRLCNHETPGRGVEALTMFTNLHAGWDRVIAPFLARTDTSRLALACTLHDSVLSPAEVETFYENCAKAKDLGVLVMVIYVVLPGALDRAARQKARCDSLRLPFLPNALLAVDDGRGTALRGRSAYTAEEVARARHLTETPHAHKLLFEARSTFGARCAAGRRYVFVDSDGEAFPCFSLKDGRIRLGNVLDGSFQPREESMACPLEWCGCPNDNAALHIVDDRYERTMDHRYLIPREGVSPARLEDGYRPSAFDVRRGLRKLSEIAARPPV